MSEILCPDVISSVGLTLDIGGVILLFIGSSHKCMHDSGMISPITRRPQDEEQARNQLDSGASVAESTAACAGPALGGGPCSAAACSDVRC